MLRTHLNDALKTAMKAKEGRTVATLRLILAALKDRDIAARGQGENLSGIDDNAILSMLQSMVKTRRESIELYEQGDRPELASKEAEEIDIIERFLPDQLDDDEMIEAIHAVIDEIKASTLKDMGRTMTALKERYPGSMDFARAGILVKKHFN
jgi:uncharacterized protein